ncbi:ureidoglycolate lyase [Bradyrhizobium sp. 147]|uniref:ureidoglycolate lyase n=1 Tax=unclassified Bradyrhizobium TaxID=2631580 RepID=UPI001FF99EF5|nr:MULTISPECIES: ureidoglycolate lyase [unclassified Bradyrhizobium]MCK1542229.1 ureidoglycolate lyase [Bradyrhizobium sp. 179]MCK1627345.1 ureidoglycolate lyase [Bradyrhizobium sp. 160]MCK1684288.1 ureidoglycolate lyase [Bradyrhizobium sp. 147]
MAKLSVEPLTRQAFAPFGEVVETEGLTPLSINQGYAVRYNDLANIDVGADGGQINFSWFVASARPAPIVIRLMERHPLGSQLFMPLNGGNWLVVVCTDPHTASSYRAFAANGNQGVNYARNCWHHPLLVVKDASSFLVVDRKGGGNNLEEYWLDETMQLDPKTAAS